MLLSAVSVLVVAQMSSEIPEGLMNNPVYFHHIFLICRKEYVVMTHHDILHFWNIRGHCNMLG